MANTCNKNSDASTSSSGASLDEINNSSKFINFLENSNSSAPAEGPTSLPPIPEQIKQSSSKSIARINQLNKRGGTKILPKNLHHHSEESVVKDGTEQQEKTLSEIGFKTNEVEGWENIIQPRKQNLYILLKHLIKNYVKTNVTVRISDTSFNCHMIVLQCYSDFFMDCSNEVNVQLPPEKITPQAFAMIYDWMLSDEPLIQREGILELFNAANFLKIKGLINQCWVCLDDDTRFREDTAFILYLESRKYMLPMLQQIMLHRTSRFFLTLVASKDFLLLSAEEVCTLLSCNSIGVNSEVEVLMTAVRWLSYNWEERQCHMLDIMHCVRFSLIPPWILVALGRGSDCVEINRIVEDPRIKRMIEDGISYTTTLMHYSKNMENFQDFLERFQLKKPVPRSWICDAESNYHHKGKCPNRQYITYKMFLEYLEMIRSRGRDHWKTLKMENQDDFIFHCCPPMAIAQNEKFNYYVQPKQSKDQGIQANWSASDSNKEENNSTTSQTLDIKTTSWCQEIYSSNKGTNNARGNFELHSVSRSKEQNNNHTILTTTMEDNKNISLSQSSSSCGDVNQNDINIKKSIFAKSYYCSMSSQDCSFTVANSTAVEASKHHRCKNNGTPRRTNMSPQVMATSAIEQIDASQKLTPSSKSNMRIANQKIFIFGGIDPYARRRYFTSPGMDVLYYDGCENSWRYLSNMPGSRHHHSATVYRGRIYVIGGTRPAHGSSIKSVFETSAWSFDPKRGEWHNECTLPQPRRDFGLIAYDNDATNINEIGDGDDEGLRREQKQQHPKAGLYVIGGESIDGTPLSSTFFYNVDRKIWSEKASLNLGRYGLAAAVFNSKNTAEIWIAGGVCGQQERGGLPIITDTVEHYNLSNDVGCWKQAVKRLRIPRLFAKFCTTGGGTNLYIIGGIGLDTQHPGEFLSLSSVDRYDFQEERWIHLTDMLMSRHGHDVVAVKDDEILIFGGVSTATKETLKSVECFSSRTASCRHKIAFLPSALSGLAAAVVADCECDT